MNNEQSARRCIQHASAGSSDRAELSLKEAQVYATLAVAEGLRGITEQLKARRADGTDAIIPPDQQGEQTR